MASTALDRRFDLMRQKTEQGANAAQQKAHEDLQRKAASQGGLGSGAFIKLGQQQQQDLEKQKQEALQGVESEREVAKFQQDEIERGRQFAREERLGSQEFAKGERIGSQQFASQEAAAQRGFDRELFDISQNFKEKAFKEQNSQFTKQMDQAAIQFNRQMDLDELNSKFNREMAEKMWNKKDMSEWFANMHGYDPRTGQYGTPGGGLLSPQQGGFGTFNPGRGGGGGGGFPF